MRSFTRCRCCARTSSCSRSGSRIEYRCGVADAVRAMLPPALAARARSSLPAAKGERKESLFALTPEGHAALESAQKIGARQLATLRALALGARSGRELADAGGSAEAARALAKRGLASEGVRAIRRIPGEFALGEDDAVKDAEATAGQATALAAIIGRLGRGDPFLLHGVTASGKTEVYLRAASAALARGLGVIVLVPEIALTAQVVARFVARFGDRVALLHSALSAGERYDEWRRVLDGVADVVVGSRSALFAPLERPGLVVVDEEQEPSYKQESAPRYHAVDTALALGRLADAVVVLGSATPRVTTFHAATTGAMKLLPLPVRVNDLAMPQTTIVDLRLELRAGNRGTLSRALKLALERAVEKGDQAILYLNRRGFATIVLCRDCGYVVPCPACDIPFAYHLDGSLVCHRCGRRATPPDVCPQCGGRRIRHLGVGTQRVEEEVRAAVPKGAAHPHGPRRRPAQGCARRAVREDAQRARAGHRRHADAREGVRPAARHARRRRERRHHPQPSRLHRGGTHLSIAHAGARPIGTWRGRRSRDRADVSTGALRDPRGRRARLRILRRS